MSPTGRCRAYPREDVRFFECSQTAGSRCDPPPDWPGRHVAHEYGAAHLTAQSSLCTHVRTPPSTAPSTRPHPREGRGMGNV
ncbi:hypothetical protein D9753_27045 [Streptomyces dangxiongensis]|uniref:Uncharacterized protein n=1 Tax=Streptomyces dangxiongensis TaxID=1442032 RepID=A0A3G2JQ14_9ACTN|nr:hypothetical protein D9753_27045 [Streptomyces dangxiongensis]